MGSHCSGAWISILNYAILGSYSSANPLVLPNPCNTAISSNGRIEAGFGGIFCGTHTCVVPIIQYMTEPANLQPSD